MQTRTDLLYLAAHLDELAGPFVGGWVCIERHRRPWRAQTLSDVTEETFTTVSGHEYDRESGKSRFESKDTCLRPLTPERLEYLMVLEALKAAEKLKIGSLKNELWQELIPAAYLILGVSEKLRAAEQNKAEQSRAEQSKAS